MSEAQVLLTHVGSGFSACPVLPWVRPYINIELCIYPLSLDFEILDGKNYFKIFLNCDEIDNIKMTILTIFKYTEELSLNYSCGLSALHIGTQ